MGQRGPKPSGNPGKTVFAHCSGETVEDLDDATYTRKRSRSFIAAEAIRLGLPLVRELYPEVRPSLPKAAQPAAAAPENGSGQPAAARRGSQGVRAAKRPSRARSGAKATAKT